MEILMNIYEQDFLASVSIKMKKRSRLDTESCFILAVSC